MGGPEHAIQNVIRLALPTWNAVGFRANVGQSWTGGEIIRLANGDVLIRGARPFSTGLPPGFSDIFGLTNEGQFFAIECKASNGKTSDKQRHFLQTIRDHGGLAGVARSVEEAENIILKG